MASNMFKSTTRALLTSAAVALGFVLAGGQAQAVISCAPGNTLDLGLGGAGTATHAELASAGFCVQAQDKLFGNFLLGNLPTDVTAQFTLNVIGGQDHHGLAFQSAEYKTGTAYTGFGYEVAVSTGPLSIVQLDAAIDLPAGTADMTKTPDPPGTGGPISFHEDSSTSPPTITGVTRVTYSPGVTDIAIAESVTDNGQLNSISNTVIESGTVPEPGSLALLGVGLAGLGVLYRRRR